MTNREYINQLSDEEFAKSRIRFCIDASLGKVNKFWYGDFEGTANSKDEAIRAEVEWLKSKVKR